MSSDSAKTKSEPSMRVFFAIWVGQAFSLFGSQLVEFALAWYLVQLTGKATVLATGVLIALLPQIVIGPFAGALVDRWNRRAVMIGADAMVAAVTIGLGVLFLRGDVQIWHIYTAMLLRAVGGIFHFAAMQASTSLLVPERHLARVSGLNMALRGAMNIAAPIAGALLMSILPMQAILSIDVTTAAIAISVLLMVSIPQPESTSTTASPSVFSDLAEGMRYVWAWPGLMILLVMATLLNLTLNPAYYLLPVLVSQHYHGGALQVSWMESASGVGVIVGGVLLTVWGGFKRKVVTAMSALVLGGAATLVQGLLPESALAIGIGLIFLIGFMQPLCDGSLFAVLQTVVDKDKQGRVFTLVTSAAALMTPIGLAVGGPLADAVGVQVLYVVAGIATLILPTAMLFIPAVLTLEDHKAGPEPAVEAAPEYALLAES